jgi:hypothetical protein
MVGAEGWPELPVAPLWTSIGATGSAPVIAQPPSDHFGVCVSPKE